MSEQDVDVDVDDAESVCDIQIERPDGLSDTQWDERVKSFVAGWAALAGVGDYEIADVVKDEVSKKRYANLYSHSTPYYVKVAFRMASADRNQGFSLTYPTRAHPVRTDPGSWSIPMIGVALITLGGALWHLENGTLMQFTFLGLAGIVAAVEARPR